MNSTFVTMLWKMVLNQKLTCCLGLKCLKNNSLKKKAGGETFIVGSCRFLTNFKF